MRSTNSADGPRVLDASVIINLLAIEAQLATQILRARGGEFIVAARVIEREVLDDPRDRARPAEERVIPLSRRETFPPIRSASKACWWKLQRVA
jgi:hypothetical protein